jgi:HK97 family phage major capsid protein
MVVLARCLALSKGNVMTAVVHAQQRYPEADRVLSVLKSAVTSGTLVNWAAPLWQYTTLAAEFIEAARPSSIVGRLSSVHRVPFNVRSARITQSSTAGWVGAGAPKPVSELAADEVTLGTAKCAGIVVISDELARSASPSAELSISTNMIATINQFVDAQFVNPANVAVADVHPGSILSGVTQIASSGVTAAAVAVDLNAAVAALINGGSVLASPIWLMHPQVAVKIALLRDTSGGAAYPNITCGGGELAGIPVLTSTSVPRTASGGSILILLDQSEVLLADDNQITIDISKEGAVQMDSSPSASASTMVSLWQANLVGILAERVINRAPRRSPAATATYIDAVMY